MTRFLVTGGAGFIGSHIVDALVESGDDVRVLDNLSTGSRQNLIALADRIDFIEGDIRSYHLVLDAMADVDYVLHQAALPSVPRSVRDPISSADVNIRGTLNVLQAAKDAGVKRVVVASSSSIYGDNAALPKHEGLCPQPLSPYAVTKLSAEQFCRTFWRVYGQETVALRYFNVFGPRQSPHSQYSAAIPKFIAAILAGEPVTVYGDGTQSRDFTYVANVVQANLLACSAPGAAGGVFNVASGKRYTVLTLVDELAKLCGKRARTDHMPPRAGEVTHSQGDIERARDLLGYEPAVGFADGLRQTVEWMVENR